MKMTVKKDNKVILLRDDVISVVDKGGAYEAIYENETGQLIYKASDIEISIV